MLKKRELLLPILVRQARASQEITYGHLGAELEIHHRALRRSLGAIGKTLIRLAKEWEEEIPQIQSLVVNKNTGLPGEGFSWFMSEGDVYARSNPRQKKN